MPFKSQAQRGLMYAAAEKKGGAGGVSQSAAKKMVADDVPGKLPDHVKPKKKALSYSSMSG
jgi:hypothetical protein